MGLFFKSKEQKQAEAMNRIFKQSYTDYCDQWNEYIRDRKSSTVGNIKDMLGLGMTSLASAGILENPMKHLIEIYNDNKTVAEIFTNEPIDERACENMLIIIDLASKLDENVAKELANDFTQSVEEIAPEFYEKMEKQTKEREVNPLGLRKTKKQLNTGKQGGSNHGRTEVKGFGN